MTFRSRPVAVGRAHAVSTPHVLASRAAIEVLLAGGTAADAAVTAAAVCVVVQPFSSSLAGVGWANVHDAASGRTQVLEFCGSVPGGLDVGRIPVDRLGLVDLPELERSGLVLRASLTPGLAGGWAELVASRGRRTLAEALEPAITLAERGFPVSTLLHEQITRHAVRLAGWPSSATVFLPGGRPPAAGALLAQPALAATLRRLAEHGPDEWRDGETAAALARFYAEHGGSVSAADLAGQRPVWHHPLETRFRGRRVLLAPAPLGDVSFASALQVLDLEGPYPSPADPDYLHRSIESAKLVGRDRTRWVGERTTPETVSWLLGAEHTGELHRQIGDRAAPVPADATAGDTITLCVLDADGGAVNLMQTVGTPFGTAAVAPGTGCLTNTSGSFAYPRNPGLNDLRPGGKLEQNPCLPIVLDDAGRVALLLSSPGGKTRVETVRQMLVNVIDHGLDLQQALDAPRFIRSPDGQAVRAEARYGNPNTALVRDLQARGHRIEVVDEPAGTGQAVGVDAVTGAVFAGADWRLESSAIAV